MNSASTPEPGAVCPPPAASLRSKQSQGTGEGAMLDELPTAGASRVAVTREAAVLISALTAQHGPLMFHQSGGCCDGSAPMCYPAGEFLTGEADVHLGDLLIDDGADPVPVWISRAQYGVWKHTRLTIDVVNGRGAGFSLEAPEGKRFLTRSRLFTDAEHTELAASGEL